MNDIDQVRKFLSKYTDIHIYCNDYGADDFNSYLHKIFY